MKTPTKTASLLAVVIASIVCQPADAQIAIASPLGDDREVNPGEKYTGTIIIQNLSEETEEAKVYQTDYLFQSDGSNDFGEPGSAHRSNASWIQIGASTVAVPPGEAVPLDYSIDVPVDIDGVPLEGSYWSLIMVEGIPRESAERTVGVSDSEIKLGVRQVVRYGIQIATHVKGTGESLLNPSEPTLAVDDNGRAELRLDVENVGSRYVVPGTWVELYGEDGAAHGRFEGTEARIYPGTSVKQRFDLGKLTSGSYTALVIFDSGGDVVDAAEYAIRIE